jgi:anaerobic selenocysteine-containing dehydrogenase
LDPASDELRSEVAIISGIGRATLGSPGTVNWEQMSDDYDNIRDAIARTIKGCEDYNQKVRKPGGFYLPNRARDNEYVTATGKANFTVNPIPERHIQPGQLILMTIRSHDQFNTTIYGLHDRYRGIHNERRVLFMNKDDIAERGLEARQAVNITSHYNGQTREAPHFIIVPYEIPKGCCAVYFPEGNVLVPIGSAAVRSNTPVSKYVQVTIAPARVEGKFDYERVDGALRINE